MRLAINASAITQMAFFFNEAVLILIRFIHFFLIIILFF